MMRFFIFSLLAVLLAGAPASAGGMPVTDVGTYGYLVEQLKKHVEMIKEAKNTVQGVRDTVDRLSGSRNIAQDLLQLLKGRLKKDEQALDTYVQVHWPERYEDYRQDDITDFKKILDEIFRDERDPRRRRAVESARRNAARQIALRQAILEAQERLSGFEERNKRLSGIAEKIDDEGTNPDVKSSQDLTNALLVELNASVLDLTKMMAQFVSSQSMLSYQGLDAERSRKEVAIPENTTTWGAAEKFNESVKGTKWDKLLDGI